MNLFKLINNSTHWADSMVKNAQNETSRAYMLTIVEQFLKPDKIKEEAFKSNYKYLSDINDIPGRTMSILNFSSINLPLGYDKWFVAAYPDVANWFQQLDDKKAMSILGNIDESELMNDEHKIRPQFLRKIVDSFLNTGSTLECTK